MPQTRSPRPAVVTVLELVVVLVEEVVVVGGAVVLVGVATGIQRRFVESFTL